MANKLGEVSSHSQFFVRIRRFLGSQDILNTPMLKRLISVVTEWKEHPPINLQGSLSEVIMRGHVIN